MTDFVSNRKSSASSRGNEKQASRLKNNFELDLDFAVDFLDIACFSITRVPVKNCVLSKLVGN